jgi:RNA polymerase sigma-54 factor
VSERVTWREALCRQLNLTLSTEEEKRTAEYIVGNLTAEGFLKEEIEEISEKLDVKLSSVEAVLEEIKYSLFPGAGAANWQEALLVQLGELESIYSKEKLNLARAVIKDYPTEFEKNQLGKIARGLGVNKHTVQQVVDLIASLNPTPVAEEEALTDNKYLQPDIIIEESGKDDYIITLSETSFPTLKLRPKYRQLLMKAENQAEVEDYVEDKLNSALWLIKSLEQRRQTIYKIVNEIIKQQKEFFRQGIEALKPLTMQQVADAIEVHNSTVSRATHKKYVQTPYGLFPLKFFFNQGLETNQGEISVVKIKHKLNKLVINEDKTNPLSDKDLAQKLTDQGIEIARRTVAKYRKELEIPSSTRRRRY